MRIAITLTLALALVGCATHQPPVRAQTSHDARLQSLREARETLVAQIGALDMTLTKLQDEHPDLDGRRDTLRQDVQQVSQAYVASQLERIDAESKYGQGHPVVRSAQKKEEQLYEVYQERLKTLSETDKLVRERDGLAEQLRDAREMLRRLDDRIAHLEDRALT